MIALAPPIIKRNQITDLKYADFVEVTYGYAAGEAAVVSQFDVIEKELLLMLHKEDLHHLRIHYPPMWLAFDELLGHRGFSLGLCHIHILLYPPGSLAPKLREIHDLTQLHPLLGEQQKLHYHLNPDFFQEPAQFHMNAYLKDLERAIADDTGAVYGYYEEDRLVGYIGLEMQGELLYIEELFVDPAYREKQLGRTLMQAAFYFARLRNCRAVTTSLACQNTGAMQFYEKCGFTAEWTTKYRNV